MQTQFRGLGLMLLSVSWPTQASRLFAVTMLARGADCVDAHDVKQASRPQFRCKLPSSSQGLVPSTSVGSPAYILLPFYLEVVVGSG